MKIESAVALLIMGFLFQGPTQTGADCDATTTTTLTTFDELVLQSLVDATTQIFANIKGPDGFSPVDKNQKYTLVELFTAFSGETASTAGFLGNYLDSVHSGKTTVGVNSTIILNKVISLIVSNELDEARAETVRLMKLTSEESPDLGMVDLKAIAPAQATLIANILDDILLSIQNSLASDQYLLFLSLKVGTTLSFAIDDTGSMGGEITDAKIQTINIIEQSAGTNNQPLLYVLSPFNDPGVGPLTKTSDPEEMITALKALTARGGGDFAELALTGIKNALVASTKRSIVFMITDADAKDIELKTVVIALAVTKKIRVISLVTANLPSPAGIPLYSEIAQRTGGMVTISSKSDFNTVTEMFSVLTAQGKVILYNAVIRTENRTRFTAKSGDVVTILLSGPGITFESVLPVNASTPPPTVMIQSQASGLIVLNVTNLESEDYWLTVSGAISYSVEISTINTFGVIPTMLEIIDGKKVHRPQIRAGSEVTIIVDIFGPIDLGTRLESISLQNEAGVVLVTQELPGHCGQRSYTPPSMIIVPSEPFFIRFTGYTDGAKFVRVDPCAVSPVVANMSIDAIDDITVVAGETRSVPTSIRSNDYTQFDVRTSDPSEFSSVITPANLVSGEKRVVITIVVPSVVIPGTLSRVTVTATPTGGGSEFLFTSFNVLVEDTRIKCSVLKSAPGSNIVCTDFNNMGSICTVKCGANYAVDGPTQTTCQSSGRWTVEADLRCRQVDPQICQAAGDPHYRSFDGKAFDFQGTCLYRLVETTFNETQGTLEPFAIYMENENRGGNKRVSWFKRAFVQIHNDTFGIFKKRKMTWNSISTELPFSTASGITANLKGNNVILTTGFGLEITFNGNANFFIKLSGAYFNQVTGLCGNMNGNMTDEFALATNSSVLVDEITFSNSHKVGGVAAGCRDGEPGDDPGTCLDADRFNRLCSVVNSECFAECREKVSTVRLIQNCQFDMCVTDGDTLALEQSLEDYAELCHEAQTEVCDWRVVADIPKSCGPNQHYEHVGSACANTCQFPDAAKRPCIALAVSGCQCNDGYVLSGTECVRLEECGCLFNGRYYKNGATYNTEGCTSTCTCANRRVTCVAMSCATGEVCKVSPATKQYECMASEMGRCVASGDPHYTTLDGVNYDFQGNCKYVFLNATNPNTGRRVLIVTENENFMGRNHVSWVKTVYVTLDIEGREMKWILDTTSDNQGSSTLVDWFDAPRDRLPLKSWTMGRFSIETINHRAIMHLDGVKISFKRRTLIVRVPGTFAGHVSGLCGNYNGDSTDDLQMSNGTVTTDVNMFGQSHQYGACDSPVPPTPTECSEADKLPWYTEENCGIFNVTNPMFAGCNIEDKIRQSFKDCVYDACQMGEMYTRKLLIGLLVGACRENGVPLCNWFDLINSTKPSCPDHSSFEMCTSACPNTCQNPTQTESCPLTGLVDGCVCDFGYLWENGTCVRQEECMCYPEGQPPVEQGVVQTDEHCTKRCACVGPNNWECEDISCVGEEECLLVGSTYQCIEPSSSCVIWGGTYISTFDQLHYNFDGECTYIAVGASHGEDWPYFSVVVDRKYMLPSGTVGMMATIGIMAESEDTRFKDMVVTMTSELQTPMVNGHLIVPGSQYEGLVVRYLGASTVAKFDFGLVVAMHYHRGIVISLSGALHNRVHGLCGNNDRMKENDLIVNTTEGMTWDANSFGDANAYAMEEWDGMEVYDDHKVHANAVFHTRSTEGCRGGLPLDETRCKLDRFLGYIRGTRACALLDSSFFAACRELVDPSALKLACEKELCGSQHLLGSLETMVAGYMTECMTHGGPNPGSIHDLLEKTVPCFPNSHYDHDARACQPICGDPDSEQCIGISKIHSLPSQETCVCDEGYIWSGLQCVPHEQCGCTHDGFYYKHGFCSYDETCHTKCQCRNSEWDCENSTCRTDQYCGNREGEWGCHYHDQCKYDNGGCDQKCESVNGTVKCSCAFGEGLEEDGKKCVKLMDGLTCMNVLSKWKASYNEWKHFYVNEWKKAFVAYQNGGHKMTNDDCPDSWNFPDESVMSQCKVEWTMWFDTDNSTGCGDDETWERITYMYPDLKQHCAHPVAMQREVVSTRGPMVDLTWHPILRADNAEMGLLCDNSDQKDGKLCPDFRVRFLCLH